MSLSTIPTNDTQKTCWSTLTSLGVPCIRILSLFHFNNPKYCLAIITDVYRTWTCISSIHKQSLIWAVYFHTNLDTVFPDHDFCWTILLKSVYISNVNANIFYPEQNEGKSSLKVLVNVIFMNQKCLQKCDIFIISPYDCMIYTGLKI